MDLVLSKLEKDSFTVFTLFQNKYWKTNSKKSHLLTISENVLRINVGGDQLSSRRYEELLGILIDHLLRFEDHILNIVQKINKKLHFLARISKYMSQKRLRSSKKALVKICIYSTNLENS